MIDVSELKKKRIETRREIIEFLRMNRGKAFTRDEIHVNTGHAPDYMRQPTFGFDSYTFEDGYYYYKYNKLMVFFVLIPMVIGLIGILLRGVT